MVVEQIADSDGYIGVHNAANEFGYYPRQVYRLVEHGTLPAVRFGDKIFVRRDDVAKLVTHLKKRKR